MKKSDIEKIIETESKIKSIGGYPYYRNVGEVSQKIYELHIQDKIEMLEKFNFPEITEEIKKLQEILNNK